MAEEKLGADLYCEFLAQRGLSDFDSYLYMGEIEHKYLAPKKVQYVTINGEKIFVSQIVVNAKKLFLNIVLGHKDAQQEADKYQNTYNSCRTLSVSEMDRALEDIIAPGLRYCLECLHYCADNLVLNREQFNILAQEVDRTYPTLLQLSDHAFELYCSKLDTAEKNAQRYKEALDRRTAGVIAAAPKTLHIQGRFHEGFFGDTFQGTAYVTSAMTQADVIQAYIGNESAARVNQQINASQIQKRTVNRLAEYAQEELLRFRDRMLEALGKCAPTKLIYRPTLTSNAVSARPFTKENIRKLLDTVEKEEFSKLKIIIDRYEVKFNELFEREICQDVLDDYIRTDRYNYPYQDIDFLLFYNGYRWPHEHPLMHNLTMDHFKDKIRKRGAELLADKKLRVDKDATVDDYFSEILDEADESELLASTYEEDAELRAVAQEQLEKLKEKRSGGLFGW